MNALGFVGGPADNFVKGAISCAVGFGIALVIGVVLGFDNTKGSIFKKKA